MRWIYATMGSVAVLLGGAIAINFIAVGADDTDCGCWWLFAGATLLGLAILAFGVWLLGGARRR